MVFASGDLSYHAMSAENYSATLTNKSVEDIKMISTMFADRVFTWKNPIIMFAVVFAVLFVICCFLDREILKKMNDIELIYRHGSPISGKETSRIHMDEIVSKYQLESEKKSPVYIGNPQDNDAGY